jgi:hypothetical protein
LFSGYSFSGGERCGTELKKPKRTVLNGSPLRFARPLEVWGEGVLAVKIGTGVETFVGCQDDVGKETDLLQSAGATRAGMH